MFNWLKSKKVTDEQPSLTAQIDYALSLMRHDMAKQFAELKNLIEAAVKVYKCVICGVDFARLPSQSDKRCPACQREIKAVSSSQGTQGNSGHRPPGHSTRGIHKGPKS